MLGDESVSEDEKAHDEFGPNLQENTQSVDSVSSDGFALRSRTSVRHELQQFFRTTSCQGLIVTLVVIDTIFVVMELLFDLEMKGEVTSVPFILHTLSLSLLALFILEILLRIYAYRFDFFTRKGDMFDAIVVIIALSLDAVYLHSHDAHSGGGLIIVLRLWRVVCIQNAMVLQVRKAGEKYLFLEHEYRVQAEQTADRYRMYSYEQDVYIKTLEDLLRRNGIPFQEERRCLPDINRFCVEAEVNSKE